MSQARDARNAWDPLGVWQSWRDTSLQGWAKVMREWVNTESYAQASGLMLESYLAATAPWHALVEQSMTQTLASLNMPARQEVTQLAERLTHIETRLDDLDAKLDRVLDTKGKGERGEGAR